LWGFLHNIIDIFSNFTVSSKLYCSTVPSQIDDGLQFGQCSWMLYKGVIRGVNDRYPHKKAAKIAIQTLKESSGGLLEVSLLVLFCRKRNLGHTFRFEAT